MNLRHRAEQISKVDAQLSSVGQTLKDLQTDLSEQLKWIEIDTNNIKYECTDLSSELKASSDYYEAKIHEKRRQLEQKYINSPKKMTLSSHTKLDKQKSEVKKGSPLEKSQATDYEYGLVESSRASLSGQEGLGKSQSSMQDTKSGKNHFD